jgi:hypothetical protein
MSRKHTEGALNTLAAIMYEPRAPYSARVAATEALLDRGWGKAKQSHEGEITHRYVVEMPPELTREQWTETLDASSHDRGGADYSIAWSPRGNQRK